ncbi:hypothetical protein F2Q69_00017217 [Brassica cretica]|uniref:Uncharacterized protein n=1 Tax=Brassica cretica TaxID=69181 RepID=A0A8S9QY75_BRACR|nr:hypothetical protein F2Q69_00017217 [Brassica cretica]
MNSKIISTTDNKKNDRETTTRDNKSLHQTRSISRPLRPIAQENQPLREGFSTAPMKFYWEEKDEHGIDRDDQGQARDLEEIFLQKSQRLHYLFGIVAWAT